MKKKWLSVLLALTLCGSLAIPVFAETEEELPVPEESEVFPAEEIPDLSEEEETVVEVRCGHLHWFEDEQAIEGAEEAEEGAVSYRRGYMCFDDSCPALMAADISPVEAQNESKRCIVCGTTNWGSEYFAGTKCLLVTADKHTMETLYIRLCQTPMCSGVLERRVKVTANHSWSIVSQEYESNNSATHTVVYNYSCECEATKTEREDKSHSMKKIDYTGNNYHKGKLHYLEWTWSCTQCGYTETRWESRTCPGNPDGTGCVFPINGTKPPVEVEDMIEPEEAILPAETP